MAALKMALRMWPPLMSKRWPSDSWSMCPLVAISTGVSACQRCARSTGPGAGNSMRKDKRRTKASSTLLPKFEVRSVMPWKRSMRWSRKFTSRLALRSLLDWTSVRLAKSESASSNNMIACAFSASSKIVARFFSVSPSHFETMRERSIWNSSKSKRPAMTLAAIVLPVPGGPWKSAEIPCPVGILRSNPHSPMSLLRWRNCAVSRSRSFTVSGDRTRSDQVGRLVTRVAKVPSLCSRFSARRWFTAATNFSREVRLPVFATSSSVF